MMVRQASVVRSLTRYLPSLAGFFEDAAGPGVGQITVR
jgi:hypothetical protein